MLEELQQAIEEVKQGNLTATDVGYDNTTSELEATNTQQAIDEVNTKVDNINIDVKGAMATSSTSVNLNIGAGSTSTGTSSSVTKSGYYPLGIVGFNNGQSAFAILRAYLSSITDGSCKVSYSVANSDGGNARSGTITWYILWVKI